MLVELLGEVGFCSGNELGELAGVFRADVLEREDSSLLLVYYCSETSLVLDDNVRNAHLSAESRDEDDELDRVDIIGNDDEVSLLSLVT